MKPRSSKAAAGAKTPERPKSNEHVSRADLANHKKRKSGPKKRSADASIEEREADREFLHPKIQVKRKISNASIQASPTHTPTGIDGHRNSSVIDAPLRSPSTDSQRSDSFSAICKNIDKAEAAMDFPLLELQTRERFYLTDLTTRRSDDLSVLFENVFAALKDTGTLKPRNKQYPRCLVQETEKANFVSSVLDAVALFMVRKFASVQGRLFCLRAHSLELDLNGDIKRGFPDYLIQIVRKDGTAVDLVVVGCKQWAPDEGTAQVVGYMKGAFKTSGVPVFGICTNAQEYKFFKYDPSDQSEESVQGFKMYRRLELMFPQMFEKGFKNIWLEQYTEFLRVLYSLLFEQLEL